VSSKRSTDDGRASTNANQAAPQPEGRLAAKAKNNLVALGSAAVFAVYGAGFMQTKAAAARLDDDTDDRRPPLPGQRTGPVRPTDVPASSAVPHATSAQAATAPATTAATRPSSPTTTRVEPAKAQAKSTTNAPPAPNMSTAKLPAVATPAATIAPQQVAAAAPAPVATPIQTPVASSSPAPAPTRDSSSASSNNSNNSVAADSAQAEKKTLKDGTFTGWGTSRHGDIQATIMIKGGKIFFAAISECMTQYSCSWISQLPPQVVARQSAEVDYVSGATQSTVAFYRAVIEAMSKAK
jgi:uncharacterized protein with FMN-binding domain